MLIRLFRSLGTSVTAATWIRNFIRSHPDYKFDSAINEEINYDLLKAIDEMYVLLFLIKLFAYQAFPSKQRTW